MSNANVVHITNSLLHAVDLENDLSIARIIHTTQDNLYLSLSILTHYLGLRVCGVTILSLMRHAREIIIAT